MTTKKSALLADALKRVFFTLEDPKPGTFGISSKKGFTKEDVEEAVKEADGVLQAFGFSLAYERRDDQGFLYFKMDETMCKCCREKLEIEVVF